MEERGFGRAYSAVVTAASATVGPIFPPSIPLVIYGAVTGVSVVKLLMGGYNSGRCSGGGYDDYYGGTFDDQELSPG